MSIIDISFYQGKKVFITGHTGFKGSWLSKVLVNCGAEVTGYSLDAPTEPSLFNLLNLNKDMHSVTGDIRDLVSLEKAIKEAQPQIVIHLAAQPIVREGYLNPVYTYETNVMGTVNLLESIRRTPCVRSVVNVTTDKVYKNNEWEWGYRENEPLEGFDPYSNSKSCSELVTQCYKNSFFSSVEEGSVQVSTARAGNVIGGGDFAKDRIIPDCVRAASKGEDIIVRNPYSIRPYQHVLEPIFAYLTIASRQFDNSAYSGSFNVGPNDSDSCATGELVDIFVNKWGNGSRWVNKSDGGPHEANYLKLDCSKFKSVYNWNPCWNIDKAIEETVEWYQCWLSGGDVSSCLTKEIKKYMTDIG